MMTAFLISLLVMAGMGGFFGWMVQANNKDELKRKLEGEKRLLSEKCEKLANHVLWMEHDPALGGEVDLSLIPSYAGPPLLLFSPPKTGVDALLDALETAEVTGIKSAKHNDDIKDRRGDLNPVVTLEFGEVSIRDLVFSDSNKGPPNLIWRGHSFHAVTDEQAARLRKIFTDRMASEAIQAWSPDMDASDVLSAAQAYMGEAHMADVCPWLLLTFDILDIERPVAEKPKPTQEKPAFTVTDRRASATVISTKDEHQDAQVINLAQWRRERGR